MGAGFSQGTANPIPINVRKQGPENTCIAFEKLQAGFPGTVPLIILTSLCTPPDPEIEASFSFPDSIAISDWLAGITELLSVGLLLNSLEHCESVLGASNVILSPAVLNAGLGRRI